MSTAPSNPCIAPGNVHMISSPIVLMTRPPWRPVTSANALRIAAIRRRASRSPRVSNSLVLPLTSANRIVRGWLWLICAEFSGKCAFFVGAEPDRPLGFAEILEPWCHYASPRHGRDPIAPLRQGFCRGDDIGVAGQHQQRGTGQWRVGVDTNHALERFGALPGLDNRRNDALADAGGAPPFVDHED